MKKSFTLLLLFAVALAGCNFAGSADRGSLNTSVATAVVVTATTTPVPPTATVTQTPLPPSATPNLTPQPTATSALYPLLTLAADSVCRMGPDKHYNVVLTISKGKSFEANGRNADGSWIALQAPRIGDDCWVPAANLVGTGDLSALGVIDTQPLPQAPMNVTASTNACGTNNLWLYWVTVNAVGYHVYQNGRQIATVYGGKYRQLDTPRTKLPTEFLYEVEGFNASGVSDRVSISVTICG